MTAFVNARPGYVNYALTLEVEPNQTIKKGDLIIYSGAGEKVRKCDPSENKYLGFATHSITTGANEKGKFLTVDVLHSQSITRGTLVKNLQVPVNQELALLGNKYGIEEEDGELRIGNSGDYVTILDVLSDGVSPYTEVRFVIDQKKLVH